MKIKIGSFEFEAKRYQQHEEKISIVIAAKDLIIQQDNLSKIYLTSLTEPEMEYLCRRLAETIKNFVYAAVDQTARNVLHSIKAEEITGGMPITITHNISIVGNDLFVWLGEYRRKKDEMPEVR